MSEISMNRQPPLRKKHNTPVVPVTLKIILVFLIFILISNFSTNYINLWLNRSDMLKLTKQLLIKDLRAISEFCTTQHEIYTFNRDLNGSIKSMEDRGLLDLKNKKAVVLAISKDQSLLFQSSKRQRMESFPDAEALNQMIANLQSGVVEGFLNFHFYDEHYFGVYKYSQKWDAFILRAEEENEFMSDLRRTFRNISIMIVIITVICAVVGVFLLRYILRFIRTLTKSITQMIDSQKLETVDLKGASNDDVTFLGVAFNSLSSTVDNLINIFKKFVNRDIALRAYQEREVRLEGKVQDLTILFSDIKGFTFITETLGADIIKLLNIHYDRAIREILDHDGIIGSIIGDAILAVYGVVNEKGINKSYQAVQSAYKIQEVCEALRQTMHKRKEEIERKLGRFTRDEERVYQAVLLQIGVGIDGGDVFYGNIGSHVRMTNTVIGDNVNSASRLEGLTREYRVPVICSRYIKEDIEANIKHHGLHFLELDKVQVKGKTIGKTVFWPIEKAEIDKVFQKNIDIFTDALQLYYKGDWKKASPLFKKCTLDVAQVFRERTTGNKCPKDWNGIWQMKTK